MLQTTDIKVRARSNASQRIIAVGIVIACLYFASSIIIALLLAILLAYFLDPVVGLLDALRHRVPGPPVGGSPRRPPRSRRGGGAGGPPAS